jgi:hypothetical protein
LTTSTSVRAVLCSVIMALTSNQFLYAIPFISFDIANHKATIYDSGNAPWTGTTLASVAKAVANVLLNPVQTANREVKTRSIQSTQNEILSNLQTATMREWEVQRVSAAETAEKGRICFQAGRDAEAYGYFFASQIWEDEYERGMNVSEEGSDNVLLGVESERLNDIVKRVLAEHA